MGDVVQRSCPNCGAPVSPQHTLMQCEFCNSPLIVVKPQPAPPPPPVSPFGAYGGNVMPAPPHAQGHVRVSGGPVIAIALAGLALVGATTAFLMIGTRAATTPPPPPGFSPPSQPPAAAGAGVADQAKMFESQCNSGNAQSCVMAGAIYEHAAGGSSTDKAKARAMYERACSLGDKGGCQMRDMMNKGF